MTRDGFALIIVLVVTGALAALAAFAALEARISGLEARAAYDQARLRAAIEAAVWRADAALAQDDDARRWQPDGRVYEVRIDDITLTLRPLAQTGRMDLNTVDGETLARLVGGLGAGLGSAGAIAAALSDRRGDEGEEGRPFLAREEFRQLDGVDAETYRLARLYLSVNTGETVPAFAPPRLLEALGLPTGEAARILGQRRSGGAAEDADGNPAFDPSPGARYAIFIEAEADSGASMAMEIEFAAGGEGETPVIIRRAPLAMGEAERLFDPDASR